MVRGREVCVVLSEGMLCVEHGPGATAAEGSDDVRRTTSFTVSPWCRELTV